MGFLRVLLAIAVICAHSTPIFGFQILDGRIAVQTFFIISGFYMSLILNEKYMGKGSYLLFFSNRLLRLYPIYWTVLLLTILIYTITGLIFGNWLSLSADIQWFKEMSLTAHLLQILTNIFLFGQDLVMFLGMDSQSGQIFFTPDFHNTSLPFWRFLLVPQAWSLGVELLFYSIAPLIVRRSPIFILLFVSGSMLLRGYIYLCLNLNFDPWAYRFFPTELSLFLLGVLSYNIYKQINSSFDYRYQMTIVFLFGFVTMIYQFIPGYDYKTWVYYSLACFSLPFIFSLTKNSKFDSRVGELSYPMYLIHHLVIGIVSSMSIAVDMGEFLGPVSVALSIAVAAVLVKYIADPIERFRQARVSSGQQN